MFKNLKSFPNLILSAKRIFLLYSPCTVIMESFSQHHSAAYNNWLYINQKTFEYFCTCRL